MKKALLIVAHGSRRTASNEEIRTLATRIAAEFQHNYQWVYSAFLELAEPNIPDGIQTCINAGATDITIMPFFLSAGRHVVEDVPALVRTKQKTHPHITIRMAPYLGVSNLMPSLIIDAARTACHCTADSCNYPTCLNNTRPT